MQDKARGSYKKIYKLKKKKGDTATKTRAHTEIHQRMMSEGKIK